MELLEGLLTRRSIRKYQPGAIKQTDVDRILEAAMHAPSAHNHQPWHFIIIDERTLLMAIRAMHPYADMLKDAAMAILVCGDRSIDNNTGYLVQDCAAATQNILLAAHGLNLGAVWIGIYPREERLTEITHLLELPEHILPVSIVSLGIAAEQKTTSGRFKRERIHSNKW
jgi:nitroreductase